MSLQGFTSQKVLLDLSKFTGCKNCPNKLKLADITFTEEKTTWLKVTMTE